MVADMAMRWAAPTVLCCALVACVPRPVVIDTPRFYTGTVTSPRHTPWFVDYCNEGRLVEELPEGCVQLGGGIQKVTVLNLRDSDGRWVSRRVVVGFPSSGLVRSYSERKRMELVASPVDFHESTGIEYFARTWSDP